MYFFPPVSYEIHVGKEETLIQGWMGIGVLGIIAGENWLGDSFGGQGIFG